MAGGLERISIDLMNAMVRRGHVVSLMTWDKRDAVTHYPLDSRVQWLKLDIGNPDVAAGSGVKAARIKTFRKFVSSFSPDAILGFQSGAALFSRIATLGMGIKIIAAERVSPDMWKYVRTDIIDRLTDIYSLMLADRITVQFSSYIEKYPRILRRRTPAEPDVVVDAEDVWNIMYTSGTTGKPKGVVGTHENNLAQYVLSAMNTGIRPDDCVMLVMPMCHINSIYYSFTYTYCSARVFGYNMVSFDPEDLLKTIQKEKITFTSLVPTPDIMILSRPDEIKKKYDVSSMRQLLISSAPARKETKMAIMEYFKNAELWEAYGSTEAGLVTLLRPEEQFKKLGSIGREVWGTDRIKILDENGKEVKRGEVGELYSRTPHVFKEYWKDPEKTKSVFQGEWFSAGDMACQDEDGYFTLVDRKANMIITGGENVFPSEVENMLGIPNGETTDYMPFSDQAKSVFGLVGVDITLHKNVHLIPNVELAVYDDAGDGTTPGTDVMPRVTLFFSW